MLREAGVVDAGGYGLTVLFAGVIAALRGERAAGARPPPRRARDASAARVLDLPLLHELRRHRQRPRQPRGFVEALERIGDSVLVVGDETTLKVHVHTDDPDAATRAVRRRRHALAPRRRRHARSRSRRATRAARRGAPATQRRRRRRGRLRRARGRLRRRHPRAVRELGFHTLDGGATLNPSTYDLLAGIHAVPAEEVVVLPNSANVFMAAERAAELSEKRVHVVRSRSQQAGLAAAVAFDPARDGAANAAALDRRAGARAHRRGRPGRARRRRAAASAPATRSASSATSWSPGAKPRGDAARRARDARRRRRAGHVPQRRRRAARRRRRRRARWTAAPPSWSSPPAASPPTGGSSPPSSRPLRIRAPIRCRRSALLSADRPAGHSCGADGRPLDAHAVRQRRAARPR